MIKPTIGRIVWFTPPHNADTRFDQTQPLMGTVVYVWNDRMINVAGYDQDGNPYRYTSVQLLQDGDEASKYGCYAEWMPYQVRANERHEKGDGPKAPSNPPIIEGHNPVA